MKITSHNKIVFAEYLKPLRELERAFRSSGLDVTFKAVTSDTDSKYLEILYAGRRNRVISIEGDSPAQAIKL
ncbi:hypothetical protein AGMMS50268_37230 [Spirochaetia bacterium]|nr:hypothetical protein AGMMS50268_37230 [Spirochaetia bacterium]